MVGVLSVVGLNPGVVVVVNDNGRGTCSARQMVRQRRRLCDRCRRILRRCRKRLPEVIPGFRIQVQLHVCFVGCSILMLLPIPIASLPDFDSDLAIRAVLCAVCIELRLLKIVHC